MKRFRLMNAILLFEFLGFALVVALVWIDEMLDIPSWLFGAPQTPANWTEACIESVPILVLAVVVIYLSMRWLNKIRVLEGLLPICSDCRRIRVNQAWIPIERYIEEHSEAEFTYSLCSVCVQRHYGDRLAQQVMRGRSAL